VLVLLIASQVPISRRVSSLLVLVLLIASQVPCSRRVCLLLPYFLTHSYPLQEDATYYGSSIQGHSLIHSSGLYCFLAHRLHRCRGAFVALGPLMASDRVPTSGALNASLLLSVRCGEGLVGLSVSAPRSYWSASDISADEPARIPCVVAAECARGSSAILTAPDHVPTFSSGALNTSQLNESRS
jgi:hypothetical protein